MGYSRFVQRINISFLFLFLFSHVIFLNPSIQVLFQAHSLLPLWDLSCAVIRGGTTSIWNTRECVFFFFFFFFFQPLVYRKAVFSCGVEVCLFSHWSKEYKRRLYLHPHLIGPGRRLAKAPLNQMELRYLPLRHLKWDTERCIIKHFVCRISISLIRKQ